MVITRDEKILLENILASEKKLSHINFERLKNALVYIKKSLIDSDDHMYLAVDSLIDISNIITGSNNIALRKVNVKSCGYDKIYIGTILIEHKIYQFVDQFNERKIYHKDFYLELPDNISEGFVICYVLAASFFRLNPTIKLNHFE